MRPTDGLFGRGLPRDDLDRQQGAYAATTASDGLACGQASCVPVIGFTAAAGSSVATSSGDHAITGAAPDHAAPASPIRDR
jgi:hypothetical protein